MCKRSTVDHQHEAAWPLAVVMSDELGHAGRDTLEGIAIRVAWELAGDDTVLLQDPALREELLDGVQHLRVDGYGDRKSTRLNSSHSGESRMPSSA